MLFTLLLLTKILLFMNITKIKYNQFPTFIISALITVFIFSLIHLSNKKGKGILELIIYSFISVVMFADIMYFSYFSTLPSIKMLSLVGQVSAVGDSLAMLFTLKNALFLLDIPLLLIYVVKTYHRDRPKYSKHIRWGVPAVTLVLLIGMLTFLNSKELLAPISTQELFTYHISDIKGLLSEEDIVAEGRSLITQEDLEELKTRSQIIEGKYTGAGKGKNLIVIQMEALQNFVINRSYEGQEITPNLNKLIGEQGSLYFNNYYQQIGRGNTSDAEFVTNNSLYPSNEVSIYAAYGENTFYGLPWILRDNGYSSWVFHGYEKEFWNREKAYPNQGFQRFVSQDDYEFTEKESVGFGIIDEVFYDQTMDYIEELDSIDNNPFHAFIISLTSHTPFEMPEKLQALDLKKEHQGTLLGNYIQAIHYADEALGQFIESLKEEGYYDNSVIAIYGDHYAVSSLNGPEVEIMSEFLGEPYDLDEMLNVPLIIQVPGLEANETIDKLGSQIDFLPTILNIMGYENEKGIMFGRDLLSYEGKTFVAPVAYPIKGSFIDDEYIFQMSTDGIFKNSESRYKDTKEQLQDLNPLRDTYELVIEEVNRSNYILKKDLLKHLIENNGKVDLDSLTTSNLPNENILKCYNEPMKQLEDNILKGNKILSVQVQWSEDNERVILNDGTDFNDLTRWMVENEGVYIHLKSNEEDLSALLRIRDNYPTLMKRLIPEMTDFKQHIDLSNKAYENIILNLTEEQYTEEETIEFLNRTPLAGVIINKDKEDSSLTEALKNMKIPVYIQEENSINIIR